MKTTTYHEFDHDGKHYQLVYDEEYQSEGSWGLDSEEETAKAVAEEQSKLNNGEYVALGCIVTGPCPDEQHCSCCTGTKQTDSLWGMVSENDHEKAKQYAIESI